MSSENTGGSVIAMRTRIIANPHAGGGRHRQALRHVVDMLRDEGWEVDLCFTDAPGAARRLAHEATQAGMDIVVAAGGDGTINETIQALAQTQTALGILPMGTVNVWAREVGIPFNLREAARVLLNGQRRRIDLGVANERYFLLMAGVGLDAEVTRTVERHRLKRWGLLAYGFVTFRLSMRYRGTRVCLFMNSRRLRTRALLIIIGNTQLYAGAFHFTGQARCDDGLLDVCIIRRQGFFSRLHIILNAFRGRPRLGPRVTTERCTSLHLEASPSLPIQVDGEPVGTTPLDCHVAPAALAVIVPAIVPEHLFSHALEPTCESED